MRLRLAAVAVILTLTLVVGDFAYASTPGDGSQGVPALTSQHDQKAGSAQYQLLAWSELGMQH